MEDNTQSSYRERSMQATALPADLFTLPGEPFWSLPYVGFQWIGACQGFSWALVSLPDRLQGTASSLLCLACLLHVWHGAPSGRLPRIVALLACTTLPCWDSKWRRCRLTLKGSFYSSSWPSLSTLLYTGYPVILDCAFPYSSPSPATAFVNTTLCAVHAFFINMFMISVLSLHWDQLSHCLNQRDIEK